MDTRAPKEIMTRIVCSLEESGEQDICSLLNEVMQVESVYGTGAEVAVFVRALLGFERAGLIGLRDYVVRGARTQVGGRFGFADRDWRAAFAFDRVTGQWVWMPDARVLVESIHQGGRDR